MPLDSFCDNCKQFLKKDIKNWVEIQKVISSRPSITPEQGNHMHYQTEKEDQTDKKALLQLDLLFDSRNYKILRPPRDNARIITEHLKFEEEKKLIPQSKQSLFSGFDYDENDDDNVEEIKRDDNTIIE